MSMTSTEAAVLCRYVAACCPQQKFDPYTPDAWFDLLSDLPFDLCKTAAREVAKRQPFVAPAEIRTAVAAMRRATRSALREAGYKPIEWDGESPYRDWQQQFNAELAATTDDAIRAGGVDFARINLAADDPDAMFNKPSADLIASIARALPQIERA